MLAKTRKFRFVLGIRLGLRRENSWSWLKNIVFSFGKFRSWLVLFGIMLFPMLEGQLWMGLEYEDPKKVSQYLRPYFRHVCFQKLLIDFAMFEGIFFPFSNNRGGVHGDTRMPKWFP